MFAMKVDNGEEWRRTDLADVNVGGGADDIDF
jgi:hypothetical protein